MGANEPWGPQRPRPLGEPLVSDGRSVFCAWPSPLSPLVSTTRQTHAANATDRRGSRNHGHTPAREILRRSYCPSRRKGLESGSRVKGNSMQAAVSFHNMRQRAERAEAQIDVFLTHLAVRTTMIYTHVLNRGLLGVRSPVDGL